jgi:hypothetical protein
VSLGFSPADADRYFIPVSRADGVVFLFHRAKNRFDHLARRDFQCILRNAFSKVPSQEVPMMTASRKWARFVLMLTMVLGGAACGKKPPGPVTGDTTTPPVATAAQAPEAVPTIVSIRCAINKSDPPQLVLDVGGEVPTGGWTDPLLNPRTYVTPPANGIWEYDFTAVRPTGTTTQVITPIAASHTWSDYPAATLKGVRVYGVGTGMKESSLIECNNP